MTKTKLLLFPLIASALCSCTIRVSHYKALIMISSQTPSKSSVSFDQFEGKYVMNLKKTTAGEGTVAYSVSLGVGKVNVYYAIKPFEADEDKLLFTINGGDSFEGKFGYVEKGYKVYVTIVSEGKVDDGKFQFELVS